MFILPPAPKHHEETNQNVVRRELQLWIRLFEERLTKLGV